MKLVRLVASLAAAALPAYAQTGMQTGTPADLQTGIQTGIQTGTPASTQSGAAPSSQPAIPAGTVAGTPSGDLLRTPRPQYALLPGDIVDIHYRYTPIFDQTVTIPPDSYVDLNVVGRIYVGGLTLAQVQSIVEEKANDRLNEPEITLTLKQGHTAYVVVAGEVSKPGRFDLQEGSTALRAIMLAGGFGDNARAGEVLVFRQVDPTTAEVHVLKLGRLDRNRDLKNDLVLRSGDTIMVPHDRIFVVSRFIKLANVGFYLNPLQSLQ